MKTTLKEGKGDMKEERRKGRRGREREGKEIPPLPKISVEVSPDSVPFTPEEAGNYRMLE